MKHIKDYIIKYPIISIILLIIPLPVVLFSLLINNPKWTSADRRFYLWSTTFIYVFLIAIILNGKNAIYCFKASFNSQLGNESKKNIQIKSNRQRLSIFKEPTFIDVLSIITIALIFFVFYLLAIFNLVNIIYSFTIPFIIYGIIGIIRKRIKTVYFVATGIFSYFISSLYIIIFIIIFIELKNKL